MSETWSKAGENLVRHRGGTYYLRAWVGGKVIRISLETKDLRIAKLKRDTELDAQRQKAAKKLPEAGKTLGDALEVVRLRLASVPDHKDSTRHYYDQLVTAVKGSLPADRAAKSWTADEARVWWKQFTSGVSATRANGALRIVRMMFDILVESGSRRDNPGSDLKRRRVPQTGLSHLPQREKFEEILKSIRSLTHPSAKESADFVEWLAWSGMRVNEVRHFWWEHEGKQWLEVTGGPNGTKNHRHRHIPKFEALKRILDARRYPGCTGPVFSIKSPRFALTNACKRLGIPHIRIHDLKHLFMTTAIEKGVDIPTVSKWGGHQDGGVLAMRTYGHIRDDHSLEEARKMR